MSFTSHELSGLKPPSGSQTDGAYGFQVVWRLLSNSADDGPNAALSYVAANIARRKDKYTLEAVPVAGSSSSSPAPAGSADSNSRAELVNVEVEKEPKSENPWLWYATLTYEEEGGGEGEKPDGSSTGDPTEFAAEVEISTVQYLKPCRRAYYKSGFSGKSHTMLNDQTARPICVSNLTPVTPEPDIDDHRWVIRIKKNVSALDCDTVKVNCVNSKTVTISYRGLTKSIPPFYGKTRDLSATPVKHPVIGWYIQVQMFIDLQDASWLLRIQDIGRQARALIGDPDGKGGVIYSDSRAFADGMPPLRDLQDGEGNPALEYQLLDGDGQPLIDWDNPGTSPVTPKYGIWLPADWTVSDFNSWGFLADVITTDSSP
jgi:hypothetical protein